MSFEELESIYEKLATSIDAVGPEKASLYLSKVALLLAHELDDSRRVLLALDECRQDL